MFLNFSRNVFPSCRSAARPSGIGEQLRGLGLLGGVSSVVGSMHGQRDHLQLASGPGCRSRLSGQLREYGAAHGCRDKPNGTWTLFSWKRRLPE